MTEEVLPDKPKLRLVEAFPIDTPSGRLLCIRDPMGVSQQVIAIPRLALPPITLMDGTRTLVQIQEEFMRRYGEILPTDFLERLVSDLDACLMLESERYHAHVEALEKAFLEAPFRVPTHAGTAYEEEREALERSLEDFFQGEDGPGRFPSPDSDKPAEDPKLVGLVSPHIDFARGGPTYAWAWREVAASPPADVYVILGTSHAPLSTPFSVSRKGFATAFGNLPADEAFIDRLERHVGRPLEADVLVHRSEHSIELQAVWLSYALRHQAASIVPVLCGSLSECLEAGASPWDQPLVRSFLDGLKTTIREDGRRVVLVAGADLAHVGTGFGDPAPPDEAYLRQVEAGDRASLDAAVALDAEGFFETIQREGDRRRVCGLSPIYAMLRTMEARSGRLLQYRQCVDPNGFRTVTIASAAFYA